MLSKISFLKQSGKTKVLLKIWQSRYGYYSSTVDQLKHDKCPRRENGWCSRQRYISTGQRPANWLLIKAIVDVLNSLFIRLTNEGFMDRSKQGGTQNVNESFNSLV